MIPKLANGYHQSAVDGTETRILDGALQSVAAGAATMDDIAARAGVGRVTLFRRFGSKEALLRRLYVREGIKRCVDGAFTKISVPRCVSCYAGL